MAIAHSTLALTYEQLDIPRLAQQHYEQAVRFGPRNIDVRNTYAVFLCKRGDAESAREQFERIVRIPENDNPEIALTNAGVCMLQNAEFDAAEAFFRRALDRRPAHGEALLQMTLLKRRGDDLLSSRAFLQRYMASQPSSPQVLLLAVQIECELGDESARREFEDQLIRDFPESVRRHGTNCWSSFRRLPADDGRRRRARPLTSGTAGQNALGLGERLALCAA